MKIHYVKIADLTSPDARGWIGLGCFVLVVIVLGMIAIDRTLLENDAFLILATAIVITGWNGGPVGWAYQATKQGGEMADSNARIVESNSTGGPTGSLKDPIHTEINQKPGNAVPVKPEGQEDLES